MARRRKRVVAPKKRREKRGVWRIALRVFEIVLCLGVIGAFGYGFLEYAEGSTDFRVRKVEIRGLRHLLEEDVLRVSGVTSDGNILFFDEDDVRERIEALPYVRSCEVQRRFPDTVLLEVEEREAVASVIVNARSFAIDRDGVILRAYGADEMPMRPFVTMVPDTDFSGPGDRLEGASLHAALRLNDTFERSPAGAEVTISELAAYRVDDIRMYCDELLYEVRWGRGELERQVERFNLLWRELDGAVGCKEYLDLRFEADLVCK